MPLQEDLSPLTMCPDTTSCHDTIILLHIQTRRGNAHLLEAIDSTMGTILPSSQILIAEYDADLVPVAGCQLDAVNVGQ